MTSSTGWVEEALGGVYRVVLEDGRRVEASVRGRLKQSGGGTERIVVGDVVRVTAEGDTWAIAERGARRSELEAESGFFGAMAFGYLIGRWLEWPGKARDTSAARSGSD